MKHSLPFLVCITIASCLLFSVNEKQNRNHSLSEKEDINEPYDHLTYMRSYPLSSPDVNAINQSMRDMANFRNTHDERSGVWQVSGPLNINGRINSIAVDASNSNIIYVGTAFGGVFKTTNGGGTWAPMFDAQNNLPIGQVVIDPNNSNNIWVGTGDKNISGTGYYGGGVYFSNDAGATWTYKGLSNTYVISSLMVDPTNSLTLYAGTMGNPFLADNNRGLYKSTDGGTTWNQILFENDSTGVIDLIMDPNNSAVLYAATFTRMRTAYRSTFYSNQCKVYKSTNGGSTWTRLTGGLPVTDIGRIGLAISATNSNKLYAIIASTTSYIEGVYQSLDGGSTWNVRNSTDLETIGTCYGGFGWYFGRIHVNPTNDDIVYTYGVDKFISYDGGASWNLFAPDWSTYEVHADGHDLAFIDSQNILIATDGGLFKTPDNGITWNDIDNIPSTQFYHVTPLPLTQETFYGGAQDNGTIGGNRSNSSMWNWAFGGDGFKFYASPTDTNLRYYETQWAGIYYDDNGSFGTLDAGLSGTERFNWNTPYMLDHFDPTIVYLGAQNMFKMTGAPYGFFSPISSDLTNGVVYTLTGANTITAVAQSYQVQQRLFAGTTDANVWTTPDGGTTWNDISAGLPNRYVTSINASPNTSGNVYISFSGYRLNDNTPHIYKSTNNGSLWTNIQGDLPNIGVNDIIVENGNENHIIIGTDAGVYHSTNGGVNWTVYGSGMPMVAVMELEYNETGNVLAAATFGRAVMVMDVSTVGVNEIKNTFLISVYPNPVSDILCINASVGEKFAIHTIAGEMVREGNLNNGMNTIDARDLSKGTYLVSVFTGNRREIKKIIKQ